MVKDNEIKEEVRTAYQMVRYMLKNKPDSRNDDMLLWFYVDKYCRQKRIPTPSYSTCSRARRKIQNQEGLFQADEETQERRKRKEEAIRRAYSSLGVANAKE